VTCKWRELFVVCPECHITTTWVGVFASADGELLFQGVCPKCKEKIQWRVFASALAYRALAEDLDDEKVKRQMQVKKGVVRPPLAIPAPMPGPPKPLRELSEEDMIDLRGLGIADDPPEPSQPTPPNSS
jgi:hypothetical protein